MPRSSKPKPPPQAVTVKGNGIVFSNPLSFPNEEAVAGLERHLVGLVRATIQPIQTDTGSGFRLGFTTPENARASFGRMFCADSVNKKDADDAQLGKLVEALVDTSATWNDDKGMDELGEKVLNESGLGDALKAKGKRARK